LRGGGNFICRRGAAIGRPLVLYAQLWQLQGVSDAGGFAALAAAAVVKIEHNNCGGDSGDERRWYRQWWDF